MEVELEVGEGGEREEWGGMGGEWMWMGYGGWMWRRMWGVG